MRPCKAYNRPVRQSAIRRSVELYPTGQEMVDQIISVYHSATEDEKAAGRSWYSVTAGQVCEDVRSAARTTGVVLTFSQAAGILAALSPATGWGDNCAGAIEFVLTGNMIAQTPLFNARAAAILAGARPLDVLGGRKVRSFYRNIVAPFDNGAVTIDRHAVSLVFGRPLSERTLKPLTGNVGGYQVCAAAYRAAARRLNILPCQLQAITWIAWRNDNQYKGRNADLAHNTTEEWNF